MNKGSHLHGPAAGPATTGVVSVRWLGGYLAHMRDLVCPECSSSISFASASMVASCTLCGADLDLSSADQVEVDVAPAANGAARTLTGSL